MDPRLLVLPTLLWLMLPAPPAAGQTPEFSKAASGQPELVQEGPERFWCPVCGMHLPTFYKTSHASGQPARQYCSIRCLAVDLQALGQAEDTHIQAVDASSERLVEARSATYVLGSDVPGTMSRVSKLAFADRQAAEAFRRAHGGRLASFSEALDLARASLAEDAELAARRKATNLIPAGERIARERCRLSALPHRPPPNLAALKAELVASRACGELTEQALQQLAVHLWEGYQNRPGPEARSPIERIQVPETARCPVCGMRVHLYPAWAAEAQTAAGQRVFFDGAKCMFRHLLRSPGSHSHRVTSYYLLQALDAREAHYVIGSDVIGPMGHELIPFPSAEQAEAYRLEHRGTRVLRFGEVDASLLDALDRAP
jgi:nitrous oxide reductase accessory protein NosL